MGDDKAKQPPKKDKAKEKKPSPFRNGLIIGLLFGAFLGLLIDTPGFLAPVKDPIAGVFGQAKKEALTTTGQALEGAGKSVSDTGKGLKEEGSEEK